MELELKLTETDNWVYNSQRQNLIDPQYDLLSIHDFDLYIAALRTYVEKFWKIEQCEFYSNRLRKEFYLRIPLFNQDMPIYPENDPWFYSVTRNKKDIQNFQNLLNLYFGLFDEHKKEKRVLLDTLKSVFKRFKKRGNAFDLDLLNSSDEWMVTYNNVYHVLKGYPKIQDDEVYCIFRDLYRQMDECDF